MNDWNHLIFRLKKTTIGSIGSSLQKNIGSDVDSVVGGRRAHH